METVLEATVAHSSDPLWQARRPDISRSAGRAGGVSRGWGVSSREGAESKGAQRLPLAMMWAPSAAYTGNVR
jgi:hypothetical protein